MGCTSGKQLQDLKNKKKLNLEKCSHDKRILQMINSIQSLANELEKIYSDILNQNADIPEEYSGLEPSEFLIKLREKGFLKNEEVDEIETKFRNIFNKISKIITEASFLLFDSCQNKMMSKQNEQFLFTFILLYEKTCKLFFEYYDQKESKKFFEIVCSKSSIQTSQEETQQSSYSFSQISKQK
ncbi:hypothetical protein ABPG74_009445 [Tetrahymena malaccensis]